MAVITPPAPSGAAGRRYINDPNNAVSVSDNELSPSGVFDGEDGYFKVTFLSTGAGALSLGSTYTVSITAGTNVLSLSGANTSWYAQPSDVGKKIAIPGAGAAGGVLFSTIAFLGTANSPTMTTITLADNAATTLTAATNVAVAWPYFDQSDVGKTMWISQCGQQNYISGTSAAGTFLANGPFMGTILSVSAYNSIVLSAAATTNCNGFSVRLVWGTDNTNAIIAARNKQAVTGGVLWFSHGGQVQQLCCAFNMTGSEAALDAQANAIWLGNNVRGFITDASGNLLRKYIIPADMMGVQPPRMAKRLTARSHLPRSVAASSPVQCSWGDSMAIDGPTQSPSWSQATRVLSRFKAENPKKTITETTNFGIGGASWQHLAGVYLVPWPSAQGFYVQNTTALWKTFPQAANPDLVWLLENGGNDRQWVYAPSMVGVIKDMQANWTKSGGLAPDIVMCSGRQWACFGDNGVPGFVDQDGIEKSGMLHRSFSRNNNLGFLDYGAAGSLAMCGWDPTRFYMNAICPPTTGANAGPTSPIGLGQKVRDFDVKISLGSAQNGAAVWTAMAGSLTVQIGGHPHNVVRFGLDVATSTNLTMTGILWGFTCPTTASITSGAAALTITGASTASPVTTVSAVADPSGGTLITTSGFNWPIGCVGNAVIIPNAQASWSGAPAGTSDFRTQIIARLSVNQIVVADVLPNPLKPLVAWGSSWTYGSMLFVPSDAAAGADIIIPGAGAAGAALTTKILTYTSATSVTLAANAGTTLSASVQSVFCGRIFLPTITTAIAAGTALSAGPGLQISVRSDELEVSYQPYRLTFTPTVTCSITSGAAVLTTGSAAFEAGMVGHSIQVPGAGASSGTLQSYIKTFTSSTSVTLSDNAGASLSAASKTLSIINASQNGGGQAYPNMVYRGPCERYGGQFTPLWTPGGIVNITFVAQGSYVGVPRLYVPQGTEMEIWGTSDGNYPSGGFGGGHSNAFQSLVTDDLVLDSCDFVCN